MANVAKHDYYEILHVTRSAELDEIKKAYRRLAIRFHPDRSADASRTEDHFKAATEAYDVLADARKRKAYDRRLASDEPQPTRDGQERGLRPYQQELVRRVQHALASGDGPKRVMMQLPTGAGKTCIAGALFAAWLANGSKAVWLTHRKELSEQTRDSLAKDGVSARTDISWTSGSDAPAMRSGVVILMAQTVERRNECRDVWARYDARDLMVVDEAHHAAAPGWERAISQWPGPVLGMTATPWRLSETEGFNHLFSELICGPQTRCLQEKGWLCKSQTVQPGPEQRIRGGRLGPDGDYIASLIEANQDRPEIMTVGALQFWQKHARDRQTVAYAVSQGHAHKLVQVFNAAGVPAAIVLGDTDPRSRREAIDNFRDRKIRVLVNVAVATEGFDLPDASCIIIARPTLSLALYLQMVGRGLRPKSGDCVILDLAANSQIHGLAEQRRQWTLEARGTPRFGRAPVVWCEECETASPASSHNCMDCGRDFGKECQRCGKWRPWRRWHYERYCGDAHDLVCDLCHIDAHIQSGLPVAAPLNALVHIDDTEYEEEYEDMPSEREVVIQDELPNRLAAALAELLESERQAVAGADDKRRRKLRSQIAQREPQMQNSAERDRLFSEYLTELPEERKPTGLVATGLEAQKWLDAFQGELTGWKNELAALENRAVDKHLIFNSARDKAMHLLGRKARDADLLPHADDRPDEDGESVVHDGQSPMADNWYPLSELGESIAVNGKRRPIAVRLPDGREESYQGGQPFYVGIVEWLVEKGHFANGRIGRGLEGCIYPENRRDRSVQLSNGMWLYTNLKVDKIITNAKLFVSACGEEATQFRVRLSHTR